MPPPPTICQCYSNMILMQGGHSDRGTLSPSTPGPHISINWILSHYGQCIPHIYITIQRRRQFTTSARRLISPNKTASNGNLRVNGDKVTEIIMTMSSWSKRLGNNGTHMAILGNTLKMWSSLFILKFSCFGILKVMAGVFLNLIFFDKKLCNLLIRWRLSTSFTKILWKWQWSPSYQSILKFSFFGISRSCSEVFFKFDNFDQKVLNLRTHCTKSQLWGFDVTG